MNHFIFFFFIAPITIATIDITTKKQKSKRSPIYSISGITKHLSDNKNIMPPPYHVQYAYTSALVSGIVSYSTYTFGNLNHITLG